MMKALRRMVLGISLAIIAMALLPAPALASTLTWSDEFNGSALDTSIWRVALPWGNSTNPGASELEHYYSSSVTSGGGYLNLRTTNLGTDPAFPYESGAVTSLNRAKFGYGYVEMRAKLPRTKGMWPALWMIDYEVSHEIDIMEMLGDNPNKVYMTYHQKGLGEVYSSSFTGPDFSADYHIFAVDWQPDSITWYIDGVQRARYTGVVKSNPLYICANTAVGGWAGAPDAKTVFPQNYSINYIRVYDSKPSVPAPKKFSVYRFYNPKKGFHFYTASELEKQYVIDNYSAVYTFEGASYTLDSTANTTPLYRFYNFKQGAHFYTTSIAERDYVRSKLSFAYTYEGIAYNVSGGPGNGAIPVYRFYRASTGSHFYTASELERDVVRARYAAVYQYEGTGYYITP